MCPIPLVVNTTNLSAGLKHQLTKNILNCGYFPLLITSVYTVPLLLCPSPWEICSLGSRKLPKGWSKVSTKCLFTRYCSTSTNFIPSVILLNFQSAISLFPLLVPLFGLCSLYVVLRSIPNLKVTLVPCTLFLVARLKK